MNRFSKFPFAVLGGVTVLMLAAPADAATTYSKFLASINEMRRFCERIDEPFWRLKRKYGCGDVVCTTGKCGVRKYSPPTHQPPPLHVMKRGDGSNGGDGGTRGGDSGGGGPNGGSSAGPN